MGAGAGVEEPFRERWTWSRKADHDFVQQEQELKLDTDLTRAVHALALEIHGRVVTDRAS